MYKTLPLKDMPMGSDLIMPIHFFIILHVLSIIAIAIAQFTHSLMTAFISLLIFSILNWIVTAKPSYRPTTDYSILVAQYNFKVLMVIIYSFVMSLQILSMIMETSAINLFIFLVVGLQVLAGWGRIMQDILDAETVYEATQVIEGCVGRTIIAQSEFSINIWRRFPKGSKIVVLGQNEHSPGISWIVEVTSTYDERKEQIATLSDVGQLGLLAKVLKGIDFYAIRS